MADAIHQEISLDADPSRVYQALTAADQFGALTGAGPVELSGAAGAAFSLFGGMITGRNVELVPGRRVVQAWRSASWAEGVYSIARFELDSGSGNGTTLVLDHAGFPEDQHDHLAAGWGANYWEPLKRYLG